MQARVGYDLNDFSACVQFVRGAEILVYSQGAEGAWPSASVLLNEYRVNGTLHGVTFHTPVLCLHVT
jgi:hypothetical protein